MRRSAVRSLIEEGRLSATALSGSAVSVETERSGREWRRCCGKILSACIIVSCTVDPHVISQERKGQGIGRKGSADLMLTSSDDAVVTPLKKNNHKISIEIQSSLIIFYIFTSYSTNRFDYCFEKRSELS